MDALFTFIFICIFIGCGYILSRDDDDMHDTWKRF